MAPWIPPCAETDDDKMEFGAAEVANENLSMRKHATRKKTCWVCAQKVDAIDYKDINTLRSFVSDRGKILPRRQTGTCAKHQRMLATALERARMLAFLPFSDR